MADSTLDYTGEEPARTRKGHGVGSLGPSDTSDSGSDIVGAPGLRDDVDGGVARGTSEDPGGEGTNTAGPDIGDGNLDSDSDSFGTGERFGAGRDPASSDRDISVDRIVPADSDPPAADPRADVEAFIDSGALADAGPIGSDDALGDRAATDEAALEDRGLGGHAKRDRDAPQDGKEPGVGGVRGTP